MGRAPCCDKASVKKGPWSPEEDVTLKDYIEKHGTGGNWIALPQKAGLRRCGKSCRLRWLNYLRPNIKHGDFTESEDRIICTLYASIGSRWSVIAAQLPGRTDNDIKNYWNTKLKKKLMATLPPLISQAQRASVISPLVTAQANSRFLLSTQLPHLHPHVPSPSLGSSWFSAPCSLPPVLNSPSSNEITFGNPLLQYPIVKDGGTIAYERACQNAAHSSSEPSNYNFSISTSSTIGSGSNSDQSVSYECFPYPGAEEKENLVPASSAGGGWSHEGVVHREWPPENAVGAVDYGFEEIKQLISTNISTGSSFLFDENQVEENVYY